MPIISVEITKTIDERELQKTQQKKSKQRQKGERGTEGYHFSKRIYIKKDNKSRIFKHLHSAATCFDLYNSLCSKIMDKAYSKFDLKSKEVYISTEKNLMHNKII